MELDWEKLKQWLRDTATPAEIAKRPIFAVQQISQCKETTPSPVKSPEEETIT